MTRIEAFSKCKRKFRSHQENDHHHYSISRKKQQQHKQQFSMSCHIFRWPSPSIVLLLLVTCSLFVVLLTFQWANCSRLVEDDKQQHQHFLNEHRIERDHHHHLIRQRDNSILQNDELLSPKGVFRNVDSSSREIVSVSGRKISSELSEAAAAAAGSSVSSMSIDESQQVPDEQPFPIVVSSSDNSYVSASPIETNLHQHHHHHIKSSSSSQTTDHQVKNITQQKHNTFFRTRSTTNHEPEPADHKARLRSSQRLQKQQTRATPPRAFNDIGPSSASPFSRQQKLAGSGDRGWNLRRQQYLANMQTRFLNRKQEVDSLLYSSSSSSSSGIGHDAAAAAEAEATMSDEKLTSSDISTTATTTQRNKNTHQNTVQTHKHKAEQSMELEDESDPESGDFDEEEPIKNYHKTRDQEARSNRLRTNNIETEAGDYESAETDDQEEKEDSNEMNSSDDDYHSKATTTNQIGSGNRDQISSTVFNSSERTTTKKKKRRKTTLTTLPPPISKRRPNIGAHYNIRGATIIKTRESIENGATFINYTLVTNLNACLVECWITDNCDTAIYQESPVDFSNHLPYLFSENNNNNKQHPISRQQKEQRINNNNIPTTMDDDAAKLSFSSRISKSLSNLLTPAISAPNSISRRAISNDVMNEEEEGDVDDDNDNGDDDDDDDDDDVYHKDENSMSDKIENGDEEEQAEEQEDEDDDNNNNNDIYPANLISSARKQQGTKAEKGFFICYLFQCSKSDGFKCQFSAHNYYVSSISRHIVTSNKQVVNNEPTTTTTQSPITLTNSQTASIGQEDQEGVLNIVEFDEPLDSVSGPEVHYSNIIQGHQNAHWSAYGGGKQWHDSHVASIRIGQESSDRYDDRGGFNSALIALLIGVCATGMLIMIVGHKMKTIRKKIAYKGRRRSVVPDADFLINTLPT